MGSRSARADAAPGSWLRALIDNVWSLRMEWIGNGCRPMGATRANKPKAPANCKALLSAGG
jgi:hypothetical protein